ncbi:MAG TPA: Sec-independent protein translocase subunit TatA [Gammaproteobacteria bacterium]|nr:Sec-independent protein translocase subunit TatA [Gammaproteobacteria bacterium]
MGGISVWQLLIVLAIVLVLFGAKRIKTLGSDLGGAVKGFKQAVKEGEDESKSSDAKLEEHEEGRVIDGEVTRKERDKV